MAAPDPRLANAGLLHLAAWSLVRQRGQPADASAWMTDAWLRSLFTQLDAGGHLEIVCTETLHWTPAQIAEVRQ